MKKIEINFLEHTVQEALLDTLDLLAFAVVLTCLPVSHVGML
jgi:hypothetical protein